MTARSRERRRPFHRTSRPHVKDGCGGNKRWGALPAERVLFKWEARLYATMRGDLIDEKKMWATLIVLSLKDFLGNDPHQRVDAARWFSSVDTAEATFVWCCDVLDFEPSEIRAGLLEMQRAARIAPVLATEAPAAAEVLA